MSKAKEYLANIWFDGDIHLTNHMRPEINKALDLQIDEDREKSVKVTCQICRRDGGCPNVSSDQFYIATSECDCSVIQDFLKLYDE